MYNLLMLLLRRFIPILFYTILWGVVIYYVEPPQSWPEASAFQILAFFIPLTLALTFLIDLFLNYLPHSFFAALGVLITIVLYAINQLTFISGGIAILITVLCIKLFPEVRMPRVRLTKLGKLLRLTKS